MTKSSISENMSIIEEAVQCAQNSNIQRFFELMSQFIQKESRLSPDEVDKIYVMLKEFADDYINNHDMDKRIYLFVLSMLLCLRKEKEDMLFLINQIMNSQIPVEDKYYMFLQIGAKIFNYPTKLQGTDVFVANTKLLKAIVDEISNKMPEGLLNHIPVNERNSDLVIVITTQLFSLNHGPTKTALDRCKAIQNKMKSKVLLINTAELGKGESGYPFYQSLIFNYNEALTNNEYIEWKGFNIPYFQCENNQLNLGVVQMLLETIRNLKPGFIVEIGCGSVVASLADMMIPVLSEGLGPSTLQCSVTSCQTLFRDLTYEEEEALEKVEQSRKNVIYSVFTSGLKDRTMKLTRSEVTIPDDAFAVALVGARLDKDINDDFLQLMHKELTEDTYYVLIGPVNDKDMFVKYPGLNDHVIFTGQIDDTRAYLELCDIYLNPRRLGGGTSAVEAMDVGVPVVTLDYGDVSVNAGDDFICSTTEEMGELIKRYRMDLDFYKNQSFKAKQRADMLQNSELLFMDTIKRFKDRYNA